MELFQGFWGCLAVEVAACALLWKFPGFPLLWSTTIDRKNGLAPVVQELIEFKLKDEEWERHGHTRGLQGQIPAKTRGKKANSMDEVVLDMWVCVLVQLGE